MHSKKKPVIIDLEIRRRSEVLKMKYVLGPTLNDTFELDERLTEEENEIRSELMNRRNYIRYHCEGNGYSIEEFNEMKNISKAFESVDNFRGYIRILRIASGLEVY